MYGDQLDVGFSICLHVNYLNKIVFKLMNYYLKGGCQKDGMPDTLPPRFSSKRVGQQSCAFTQYQQDTSLFHTQIMVVCEISDLKRGI